MLQSEFWYLSREKKNRKIVKWEAKKINLCLICEKALKYSKKWFCVEWKQKCGIINLRMINFRKDNLKNLQVNLSIEIILWNLERFLSSCIAVWNFYTCSLWINCISFWFKIASKLESNKFKKSCTKFLLIKYSQNLKEIISCVFKNNCLRNAWTFF